MYLKIVQPDKQLGDQVTIDKNTDFTWYLKIGQPGKQLGHQVTIDKNTDLTWYYVVKDA